MSSGLRPTLFASALLLAGCHATIDVEQSSTSTVKGGNLVQQLAGATFGDFANMNVSDSTELRNAGVPKENIESVRLKSFVISVTSPAGASLDFLDDIAFSVKADGQPTVLVAEKKGIADGATSVTLDLADVELAPYVKAERMSLETAVTGRAPARDTTLEAKVVFTVDPQL